MILRVVRRRDNPDGKTLEDRVDDAERFGQLGSRDDNEGQDQGRNDGDDDQRLGAVRHVTARPLVPAEGRADDAEESQDRQRARDTAASHGSSGVVHPLDLS